MNNILEIISWWYKILGVLVALAGAVRAAFLFSDIPYAELEGGVLLLFGVFTLGFALSIGGGLFYIGHEVKKDTRKAMLKSIIVDIVGMLAVVIVLMPVFSIPAYVMYSVFAVVGINLICTLYLIFSKKGSEEISTSSHPTH